MRRTPLISLMAALILLTACSNGDDDDARNSRADFVAECQHACTTGCNRGAQCQFITFGEVPACSRDCFAEVDRRQTATIHGCREATTFFRTSSCQQLAGMLGLPAGSTTRSARESGMDTERREAVAAGLVWVIENEE